MKGNMKIPPYFTLSLMFPLALLPELFMLVIWEIFNKKLLISTFSFCDVVQSREKTISQTVQPACRGKIG